MREEILKKETYQHPPCMVSLTTCGSVDSNLSKQPKITIKVWSNIDETQYSFSVASTVCFEK